ncbi:EPL1-like protein [Coniochaeta sp. 2T2.1]|nr:EPL1-like protein [Coniochaeta sp. 2T2.1]
MATRKVRYKKLNVKTPLPVLREGELDSTEYEAITAETHIATGVEQAEENEFHLQSILQSAGVSASREIPVPPPEESKINYDDLYPQVCEKPKSYIRFSQTVEECIGCPYDMNEDDDAYLKSYNEKRPPAAQLSEDDFERMMEVFEETAYIKTPFASVDQTIVPYDDMVAGLQQLDTAKVMPHAKELYEYWKSRRQALSNRPLQPSLKFERHQDSDELDPYVCFRRREVRLTRKTRARDVQSADKLKRLRRELEDGRQLIIASYEREMLKKQMLDTDRIIFEQRAQLKEAKIRLGIKTDDEDLINQKPQKRKAVEPPATRPPPPKEMRLNPVVTGSRASENDLPLWADKLVERENELRADIEQKIRNHNLWNQKFVDLTRDPLPPIRGETPDQSFRPAKTQYLMTPPNSASNESMEEPTAMDLDKVVEKPPMYGFRGVAHDEKSSADPPAYRRRIGRLNRLWIDRRGLASPPWEPDRPGMMSSDRWKYDQDSDDEGEQPIYEVDPFDTRALKFRASVPLPLAVLRGKPSLDQLVTARPGLQPPPPPQVLPPASQQAASQQPRPAS